MLEHPPALEERVELLTEQVQALERRLAALEQPEAGPALRRRRRAAAAPPPTPALLPDARAISTFLGLGGRTLLVMAGAFVLRALTDGHLLPLWLGVTLGLGFAAVWLAAADRAGRLGLATSAAVHGLAGVLIAFPLLVEATVTFHLLPPAGAAAGFAAVSGAALAIAARRRLEPLAWFTVTGGIAGAAVLMAARGDALAPPATYLVLLGGGTLWLGYVLDWRGERWPAALAADLAVTVLALRALGDGDDGAATAVLAVQFLLLAVYLGSIATRTLLLHRGVVPFEVAQAAGALLTSLGGAAFVATRAGGEATGAGAAAGALGLAAYGVAFAFVARRERDRANFPFYSTIALLLVLAGTGLALSGGARALAWGALGLLAAVLARRHGRATLAVHAAVYGVASAIAAGLGPLILDGVLAPGEGGPARPELPALAAIAAMAVIAVLVAGSPGPRSRPRRLTQLALVGAIALGGAALAIGWLAPLLGAPVDPARLAALRTAVLVAAALLLAWLGRSTAWEEAGWLAYGALGGIGLKVLLEDLPRGTAATRMVAVGAYGAALLVVQRLRLRRRDG